MRLLEANADGRFKLTSFFDNETPCYAILSHTWDTDNNQEVTYQDLINGLGSGKRGYRKIQFCGEQAKRDGLRYFWVDSCCINKENFTELSTAINSMFRWYRDAAKCYVYLSDISTGKHSQSSELLWELAVRRSKWFTRGWTLQELLAPQSVEFFSRDGKRLGDKKSLKEQIHEATGIAVQALQGSPPSHFSVDERKSWAAKRETTVEEDQVYCLLGIFDIYLPLIYGEGKKNALRRLQDEINKSLSVKGPSEGNSTIIIPNILILTYNQIKCKTRRI
jgi:Heterokaryon incompatibility protein (HET)